MIIKMKNPLTLKLNELKKFYLLNKETNKEKFKSNLKTVLFNEENNKQTKGSIVLHRLNKLLNLKTNTPSLIDMGGDSNQSGQISPKLLNKGENSTLELLKINEIKKESLLNKTGYIQLFSINENIKNKKNTLIYQYLKNTLQRISPIANTQKRNGILFNYSKTIAYNFFSPSPSHTPSPMGKSMGGTSYGGVDINKDLFKINKLLLYFFKSLNCLISKPVYLHTPDKVIIQLFYYLNIPKKKVFRLFSILYFNSFRKKYLLKKSQIASLRTNYLKSRNKGVAIAKIPFIKRKVRKAISRLRGKSNLERSLFFNLRKLNLAKVFTNKFQLIIEIITRKFKKPVVFQLIRLHHPYHDTNILANLLSLNIRNKRKKI